MVALDIDGTLIPMLVDFDELRARVRAILSVDHPLKPLGESLARLAISEELKARAWNVIEEVEIQSIEKLDISAVAENVDYVKKLLSLGFEVIFVTARSSRSTELVLSKLGLANLAKAVITRDSTPFRLEQLKQAKALAGGKKVVFVGDTQHDEESARSLGVDFVMIGSYRELPSTLNNIIDACI
ncbi:MAG: HAD hydrolase-like protein [Sulfolobales archaeon]|nr:HAD hydrolase-like protein [Sulfolobales archaeon]MDW8083018.1 HAD hydrolase-like protein [Sulfolobales archaeon]